MLMKRKKIHKKNWSPEASRRQCGNIGMPTTWRLVRGSEISKKCIYANPLFVITSPNIRHFYLQGIADEIEWQIRLNIVVQCPFFLVNYQDEHRTPRTIYIFRSLKSKEPRISVWVFYFYFRCWQRLGHMLTRETSDNYRYDRDLSTQ